MLGGIVCYLVSVVGVEEIYAYRQVSTNDLCRPARCGAMVDINLQQLGLELGSGALVGGIIGFAAKKVAKVIAIIIGLELALFKFLESRQILTVDWERLTAGMLSTGEAAASGTPPDWAMTILSTLSVSAGFTGGFLVGFKKG